MVWCACVHVQCLYCSAHIGCAGSVAYCHSLYAYIGAISAQRPNIGWPHSPFVYACTYFCIIHALYLSKNAENIRRF